MPPSVALYVSTRKTSLRPIMSRMTGKYGSARDAAAEQVAEVRPDVLHVARRATAALRLREHLLEHQREPARRAAERADVVVDVLLRDARELRVVVGDLLRLLVGQERGLRDERERRHHQRRVRRDEHRTFGLHRRRREEAERETRDERRRRSSFTSVRKSPSVPALRWMAICRSVMGKNFCLPCPEVPDELPNQRTNSGTSRFFSPLRMRSMNGENDVVIADGHAGREVAVVADPGKIVGAAVLRLLRVADDLLEDALLLEADARERLVPAARLRPREHQEALAHDVRVNRLFQRPNRLARFRDLLGPRGGDRRLLGLHHAADGLSPDFTHLHGQVVSSSCKRMDAGGKRRSHFNASSTIARGQRGAALRPSVRRRRARAIRGPRASAGSSRRRA